MITDFCRDWRRSGWTVPRDEYVDEMLAMSLSQTEEIAPSELASPFDLFGVSVLEIAGEIQVHPAQRSEDVIVVDIFDIDDEIAQHDSDDDSSSASDSGPVDERVSPVLLRAYLDVFAWSYEDMPSLDPSIVQHRLPLLPHARPVKQKLRRLHPRWSLQVKEEIQKQLSVGFLSVVEYPEWLANVVPVPKRTARSFDVVLYGRIFGYSQILMAPEDMEKTSFITEWGTYCYRVMPFGLKNAGATSESSDHLFHDMMHRDVEVYVDDMIVKSRDRSDHLAALRVRGIEVDPDKIRAILDMPAPRTEREVRGFWADFMPARFERIREYLLSPPVLAPPTPGRPYSYTCPYQTWPWVASLLLGIGLGHSPIETLHDRVFVHLISRLDPLRYLFDSPLGWSPHEMLITSFCRAIDDDFPDEDVAAVTSLSGWRISVRLAFSDRHPATNNIVEYEACILGLETALELGIRQMEVFGDSNLVLRQIQGEWKTRDVKLSLIMHIWSYWLGDLMI
ncbi:hypothetical protein CK203_094285 [Vitis vinifera]|uniref:RNase H type-1 domain-containing protein n=1 Tax=Vitis vinifera TaxID=29760 RepID=A0A438DZQ4_VITVI|nr:hypothetical protein CK203_094285 [Vitis vinifera]